MLESCFFYRSSFYSLKESTFPVLRPSEIGIALYLATIGESWWMGIGILSALSTSSIVIFGTCYSAPDLNCGYSEELSLSMKSKSWSSRSSYSISICIPYSLITFFWCSDNYYEPAEKGVCLSAGVRIVLGDFVRLRPVFVSSFFAELIPAPIVDLLGGVATAELKL